MPTAITLTPSFPGIGKVARVDFAASGGGNYLRGYFTDAPEMSEQKVKLQEAGSIRVPAFISDVSKPWLFSPEVGGVYTVLIEQYQKGASDFGGGYESSPDSFETETLIDSNTVTIAVGQKVTQRIGFAADTATLTLFVCDNLICSSSYDLQGFVSPSLTEAKTDKARTACLNSGVLTALAALAGVTATTAIGVLSDVFDDLMEAFSGHLTHVGHLNDDNDNTPNGSDLSPTSPTGLKQAMVRLLKLLDQHIRNDNNNGTPVALPGWAESGTGSGYYHNNNKVDWGNALLGLSAGDILDTFIALADAWRSYDAHRQYGGTTIPGVFEPVHSVVDNDNVPAPLPPLLHLHALFLSEIQKQTPTAPPSVNAGVTALVHGAGFEEA